MTVETLTLWLGFKPTSVSLVCADCRGTYYAGHICYVSRAGVGRSLPDPATENGAA